LVDVSVVRSNELDEWKRDSPQLRFVLKDVTDWFLKDSRPFRPVQQIRPVRLI
jgi:hypothetical protein